ncbi:MAG: baseplate J/gp47 family protein [Bacillota bacterium]|nr:baseplate J/gp47 family protein [Bacillota bacterium]
MHDAQEDNFFAATATGSYLDQRVAERGLTRDPGATAAGTITASRSTPAPFSEFIPSGTVFETEDGTVQLQTTSDATLLAGATAVDIPAEATVPGVAGNLAAGVTLHQVGVAVSLIETATVKTAFAGGRDPESDDQLRARYLQILRAPGTSGNKADYARWAMEVSGVGGVYVEPLWDGPGTVRLHLIDTAKQPAAVDLVAAVQAYIAPQPGQGEGKAPIGAAVTVVAATPITIDIAATVTLDGSRLLAEVQADYVAALTAYLRELAFADDPTVRYSRLGPLLLDVAGVTDYANLLLNGGTSNVPIGAGQVAVLGTVTLT